MTCGGHPMKKSVYYSSQTSLKVTFRSQRDKGLGGNPNQEPGIGCTRQPAWHGAGEDVWWRLHLKTIYGAQDQHHNNLEARWIAFKDSVWNKNEELLVVIQDPAFFTDICTPDPWKQQPEGRWRVRTKLAQACLRLKVVTSHSVAPIKLARLSHPLVVPTLLPPQTIVTWNDWWTNNSQDSSLFQALKRAVTPRRRMKGY